LDNSVSELSTNVSTFSILPSVVNKINDIEQVLSDLISKKYVVDNTSKEVNTLTDKIEALEKRVEELSFTISKMD
jgi:archaellum component FlaC